MNQLDAYLTLHDALGPDGFGQASWERNLAALAVVCPPGAVDPDGLSESGRPAWAEVASAWLVKTQSDNPAKPVDLPRIKAQRLAPLWESRIGEDAVRFLPPWEWPLIDLWSHGSAPSLAAITYLVRHCSPSLFSELLERLPAALNQEDVSDLAVAVVAAQRLDLLDVLLEQGLSAAENGFSLMVAATDASQAKALLDRGAVLQEERVGSVLQVWGNRYGGSRLSEMTDVLLQATDSVALKRTRLYQLLGQSSAADALEAGLAQEVDAVQEAWRDDAGRAWGPIAWFLRRSPSGRRPDSDVLCGLLKFSRLPRQAWRVCSIPACPDLLLLAMHLSRFQDTSSGALPAERLSVATSNRFHRALKSSFPTAASMGKALLDAWDAVEQPEAAAFLPDRFRVEALGLVNPQSVPPGWGAWWIDLDAPDRFRFSCRLGVSLADSYGRRTPGAFLTALGTCLDECEKNGTNEDLQAWAPLVLGLFLRDAMKEAEIRHQRFVPLPSADLDAGGRIDRWRDRGVSWKTAMEGLKSAGWGKAKGAAGVQQEKALIFLQSQEAWESLGKSVSVPPGRARPRM